jgi:hypothetical protein
MFFPDLTSYPASTPTQRDFANNILGNELNSTVQKKGDSARTNKKYAAYESSLLMATHFASSKASITRHLSSSGISGIGASASSGNT